MLVKIRDFIDHPFVHLAFFARLDILLPSGLLTKILAASSNRGMQHSCSVITLSMVLFLGSRKLIVLHGDQSRKIHSAGIVYIKGRKVWIQ